MSVEYLALGARGDHLPPLVTSSPPGTPITQAGVLGAGSTVLFGNQNVNSDLHSFLQIDAGAWLDCEHTLGIEASVFFPLERIHNGILAGDPTGTNIVSRPFFDAVAGAGAAELVSFPGVLGGTVRVNDTTSVWGGNADARYNLACGCNGRLDALAGYRYLRLSDTLQINENLTAINPAGVVPFGTVLLVEDRFHTTNDFHGGELGVEGEYRLGNLYVSARAAISLGDVVQTISIQGATVVRVPGNAPNVLKGGLLALGTNSGVFHRDDFAVLPTLNVKLGYQVTDNLRAFVGYDLAYLSTVTRPGEVIDLRLNQTQIPPGTLVGTPRPLVPGAQTDYLLQGVSGGLEFRY
jgi:hypothetical protein